MNFHVITLFPDAFESYLGESIIKRAIDTKKIKVFFYNPRDFVKPTEGQKSKKKPYLRIDDKPYGGGPGMVMQALPVAKAIDAALSKIKKLKGKNPKIIFMSPRGAQFNTDMAKKLVSGGISKSLKGRKMSTVSDLILISGRYEGIDARIKKMFKIQEISVGPYVLTGGELPAMILIDSISRQIEGVLGDFSSLEESRITGDDVYTRPATLAFKGKKYTVPKILLSGNHGKIEDWKQSK